MTKILIIGPNYYNYCTAIKQAFNSLKYEVELEQYDTPIHPYNNITKLLYKISPDKKYIKDIYRKKYKTYIEKRFKNIKPEMVFIINGEFLSAETLDIFKSYSTVCLWLFDSISRYPRIKELAKHVNYLFCYEQEDIKWFKDNYNINALFLPQACDTGIYKPLLKKNKDIDILFVGDIYNSLKRKVYTKKIINSFPNAKIQIYGICQPWYKNPIKWALRDNKDIYKNKNIICKKVNELYNSAKVVVNIHHEQQKKGANPKVFEICGAGAYQVCDKNPYISSIFTNNEIGLYSSEQELIEQIKWALNNEKQANKKAIIAQKEIYSYHTFKNRIEFVLSYIHNF